MTHLLIILLTLLAQLPLKDDAPPGMVWIPAGEFVMGTDDPKLPAAEQPAHRVRLNGFWIDETLVTNKQFRAFVEATGYVTIAERVVDWEELKKQVAPGTPKPPDEMLKPGSLVFTLPKPAADGRGVDIRDMSNWWMWMTGADWRHPQGPKSTIEGKEDYPVVQVAWDDAAAYAKWAGKRLPTEAEWEYAARGGAKINTRFWWGDELKVKISAATGSTAANPTCPPPAGIEFMANIWQGEFPTRDTGEDGFTRQSPVKAFATNGYGLYDMAGNVWQWTSDLYRADAHATATAQAAATGGCCINPQGPASSFNPTRPVADSAERVTKGGSFLCHASYCESYRPTARRGTPPDTGTEHTGFRCVISGDPQGRASQPAKD